MSSRPIVSSAHLVSEDAAELSEFEFGLNMAINAYHRWIVRCTAAAGQDGLGALDVLVLHLVNHREREKRLERLLRKVLTQTLFWRIPVGVKVCF